MKLRIIFSLFLIIYLGYHVHCEFIRQCTCEQLEKCREQLLQYIKPCADNCQRYAKKAKANYKMLRNCVLRHEDKIIQTINCTETMFNDACAIKPGRYVEKTYVESLEIMGIAEINRMLGNFSKPLHPLISTARRFIRCTRKIKLHVILNLSCGLELPSDLITVQKVKQCAIESGFDTPTMQQMCYCGISAGIRKLRDVCPNLQIS
ncbi:Histone-lysine N-methyltransferase SETDB1 [Dirofilaria immitis]|nr:hypothetical protein [Dirofilaria immitis]